MLGDGTPKIGAHGKPVLFFHPKDFSGTLVEIEQASMIPKSDVTSRTVFDVGVVRFAIYFVLWWLTLFIVLPFAIRSQHEAGELVPGTDPGAPVAARIAWRLLWNTVLSAVLFAIGVWAYLNGYLNARSAGGLMGLPF